MKKIVAIILVCLIVLSGTSVLASMTCSYCGSGGREECQGDSIGTFSCTSCFFGTRNIATHHFQCYNSRCNEQPRSFGRRHMDESFTPYVFAF